ncbi:MAG: hypothetical protein FJY75_04330 [Candidatus Eisenbacteria bacterium]|uniref:DUF6754 domain-containing protein n=1 Tax=Eiseniibacteriota bacterium TaxID=2212470 RepID=A0A937X7F7_UNCEI|nr:hypothetical protein [Candidatus Eisenbacteria bacterium]
MRVDRRGSGTIGRRPGRRGAARGALALLAALLAGGGLSGAGAAPAAGSDRENPRPLAATLAVADTPADGGSSLTLTWDGARLAAALAEAHGEAEDPAAAEEAAKEAAEEGVEEGAEEAADEAVEEAADAAETRAAARAGALPAPGAGEVDVERAAAGDTAFARIASVPASAGRFVDEGLERTTTYRYRLTGRGAGGRLLATPPTPPLAPRVNAFRTRRLNALAAMVFMGACVVGLILRARRGGQIYIRRISGLDAIDEAVGRATEMGRKILYIPGIISVNEPQTLASLGILGYVAKLTARYGTELEVPNIDPLTMAAAREIVKQSYMEEGHPEGFREEMVHYITGDQFAYAAAVNGIMVRDRPAANFLLGWFAAESLLLSETGQSIGAIQIAGTAQVTQLPFFVSACDYTMLGEELFAASAYLSRDPLILGSIAGQDVMKAAILAAIVLGVVLSTAGVAGFAAWFTAL